MTWEREEYQASLNKQTYRQALENASQIRVMAQGALAANQVTGSQSWDGFLSVVKAQIEGLNSNLLILKEKLETGPDTGPDELRGLKFEAVCCRVKRDALEWVIELPNKLKEDGKKAKSALKLLDGVDKTL